MQKYYRLTNIKSEEGNYITYVLTIDAMCDILKVSKRTLYRAIEKGYYKDHGISEHKLPQIIGQSIQDGKKEVK